MQFENNEQVLSKDKISSGYKTAFILMSSLFFIWGAIVSLNDVLIPHLKSLFNMNYTETMLIQFCYFGAYLQWRFLQVWL
jgi:FHS family L-fucose permease-like MFS transporter